MLSSNSFIVLAFTFSFMICFETLLYKIGGFNFVFFTDGYPVAMALFVEKAVLSPFHYSGHLGSPIIAAPLLKSVDKKYKDLFWMLSLFYWYVCLFLLQSTLCLIIVTFYVLKLGTSLFPSLSLSFFFFFWIYWVSQITLWTFLDQFVNFCKKGSWNTSCNCIEFQYNWISR